MKTKRLKVGDRIQGTDKNIYFAFNKEKGTIVEKTEHINPDLERYLIHLDMFENTQHRYWFNRNQIEEIKEE